MGYDGHLHEKDARRVIRVFVPLSVLIAASFPVWREAWQVALGLFLGVLCGYAITPDADHKAMTREEYRAMKKWGILGAFLVAYMTPYAYLFPHRSKWSHSLIPGTILRILYVLLPLVILAVVLLIAYNVKVPLSVGYIAFVVGWMVQDAFHYKRDKLGLFGMIRRRVYYV
jgi:uncharacterized metal-binding protein